MTGRSVFAQGGADLVFQLIGQGKAFRKLNEENHTLILDVEEDALMNAPGFDQNKWPDTTFDWLGGIYEHYGFEPYWLYEDDFDDFDEDDFGG